MRKVVSLIFAGLIGLTGCAAKFSTLKEKPGGLYPGGAVEIGMAPVKYDVKLGEQIQTIPVHPDDSNFLSGDTTTQVKGDYDLAPILGLEGSLGTKNLRFVVGVDTRYNPLSSSDGEREGMYDVRQQSSDTRAPSRGSFVFTQLNPEPFTFTPKIRVEGTLAKLKLGIEAGLPYTGYNVRSGHDRFGSWETTKKDSWRGFGTMIGGKIGWQFDEEVAVNFCVRKEKYRPEFLGEKAKVDATTALVELEIRF